MTTMRGLTTKIADFFKSEEYAKDDETARLILSADDARFIIDLMRKQRKGRWFKSEEAELHFICSDCGESCQVPTCMGIPLYEYCPHCGLAKKC